MSGIGRKTASNTQYGTKTSKNFRELKRIHMLMLKLVVFAGEILKPEARM